MVTFVGSSQLRGWVVERVGAWVRVEAFGDGGSCTVHLEDLDVLDATFATPDLTVFCRLDELGRVAVGQRLDPERAVIECRVAQPDPWCRGWGSRALSRGTDTRQLAHELFGHRPTALLVRVCRYK